MIKERLFRLRQAMRENAIRYYIITSSDCHGSEYVHEHFRAREYFSGFTGSNGTLCVGENEAALWTDGRYFLQAEEELAGTGIALMKMREKGVPTIEEYLAERLRAGETLGFDGNCVSADLGGRLEEICAKNGAYLCYEKDLAQKAWQERPPLPCNPVWELEEEYAGESCADKLAEVRRVMEQEEADWLFLSALDDIMWLFNLRGGDIACNPVALSYAVVGKSSCTLFLQKKAAAGISLKEAGVTIEDYGGLYEWAKTRDWKNERRENLSKKETRPKILASEETLNYRLQKTLAEKGELILGDVPTELLKAIKNETELSHIRETYLRDSAAVCKFIFWLKHAAGRGEINGGGNQNAPISERERISPDEAPVITELSAAEKLDGLRKNLPGFLDLSFPTICGYAENGAIVHYEATEKTNKTLLGKGMVLIDSGGQYKGGTTDITRTVVLGKVSEEEKELFSSVAAGMLRLADAVFPEGATGRNLDILARQDLWQKGLDYRHGTGHGVGYALNVHEGPQKISWQYDKKTKEYALRPGMLISDEPGVYLAGRFGIRTENILEVVKKGETEYGSFLGFSHLTYVPIDRAALDKKYLSREDISRINAYHKMVYEKVSPYLETKERGWLREATAEL